MPRVPCHTSYFSIASYLSTEITSKTSIALDIARQYYKTKELNGEDIRKLVIEGYGEFISFEEVCLGLWMVFDKLYGPFPPDDFITPSDGRIGWNGAVINPSVDIPMALRMYEDLSSSTASFSDKIERDMAVQRWFKKLKTKFLDYESYNELETLNKPFYDWIVTNLEEIDEMLKNEPSIDNMRVKDYIFDVNPKPKWMDSTYKPLPHQLGIFNSALLYANNYYCRFLTVLEQVLYGFTRIIFPIKLYGIFTYMFNIYVRTIVNYLKPYHCTMLEVPPIFQIGPDSINIGESVYKQIYKTIIDTVVHRCFDHDVSNQPYDVLDKIREEIRRIHNRGITDTIEINNIRIDHKKPKIIDEQSYNTLYDTLVIKKHTTMIKSLNIVNKYIYNIWDSKYKNDIFLMFIYVLIYQKKSIKSNSNAKLKIPIFF